MLESFPALAPFALTVAVLCANLLVIWNGSGVARARSSTTPNPEDPALFGARLQVVEADPPTVARWMRAHRNAVAAIVPFSLLALAYVLLGGSAVIAWWVFGLFAALRVLHSIAYVASLQPWRTVAHALSQLDTLALLALVVIAAL